MSARAWVAWSFWLLATLALVAATGGLHEIA